MSNNSSIVSPPSRFAKPPTRMKKKKLIMRGDYNKMNSNRTIQLSNVGANRSVSPFVGSSISGVSPTKAVDTKLIRQLGKNNKIFLKSDPTSSIKSPSNYSRTSMFRKMYSPTKNPIYDYNKEMCEKDEDFDNIYSTEMEFRKDFGHLLHPENPEEIKLRENLICKIKKICDEYELSDDTFFRTIFIYDFHRRVVQSKWEDNCVLENKPLSDLFIFGEGATGEKKLMQYEKFFDMLSCLTISIKYYEHERESPGVRHILKFFRIEKLVVKIKTDEPEIKKMTDLSELIFDIIYEYICEKQTEILFMINWKMQIINPKHFINHFVRILPSLKTLQTIASRQNKVVKTEESKENNRTESTIHPSKDLEYSHKILKEEIEDCIDSVAKLSPLVPCYIEYNCAEVASAALMISIKHSVKTILNEGDAQREDVNKLKALYSRWTASLFKHYCISKSRISEFCEYLDDFLNKVCE
ncbi:unnamed protein product [Moneuplotes crassus]|uniref:Uncharacterized protein n=1 Tax=Euplotes crassus TaxID=5936 RepID=A0AAD2D8C7_EUPCR|nr:unnamed protein product [Moneuplotes crassus]